VGMMVAFIIGRMDLTIRGLFLAIPGLFGSYLLLSQKRERVAIAEPLTIINSNEKFFLVGYICFFILSIIILYVAQFRTLYYFICMSILFCFVGAQIISKCRNCVVILSQIILITMNLIYGVTLNYPLFFGSTDTLSHLFYIDVTFLSGHIIPLDLSYTYSTFPLYHILLTQSAFLLGLNIQFTFFVITCIPYAILILFIFMLFKIITKNEQISLLTCLLFSFAPIAISYGPYVVTRVFAFIGFIILLYLLYIRSYVKSKLEHTVLIFLVMLFVILVHQVSILQIIPLFICLLMFEWLINGDKIIGKKFVLLISIIAAGYWIYTSQMLTESIVSSLKVLMSARDMTTMMNPSIRLQNASIFLWTNIETSIIVFLIVLGIGYILWRYKSQYLSVYGLFALATIIFYIPNPLQLFWVNMVIFRADRVSLLVAPFFAFVMSWGIYALLKHLSSDKISSKIICISIFFLIVFSLSLLSLAVSNGSDAKDINFDEHSEYFNQQELKSFEFIIKAVPYGSTISSDYYVNCYFNLAEFSESKSLGLPYYTTQILSLNPQDYSQKTFLVFRKTEFMERGLFVESKLTGNLDSLNPTGNNINNSRFEDYLANKIFDNKDEEVMVLSNNVGG
jgi:hypothetical protein